MLQIALGNCGKGALNLILFSIIIPAILDVYNEPGTSPDCLSDRANITTSILQIINIIFVLVKILHIASYLYLSISMERARAGDQESERSIERENKETQEGNSGILVQNLVDSRPRKSWCFSSGPKARKKTMSQFKGSHVSGILIHCGMGR